MLNNKSPTSAGTEKSLPKLRKSTTILYDSDTVIYDDEVVDGGLDGINIQASSDEDTVISSGKQRKIIKSPVSPATMHSQKGQSLKNSDPLRLHVQNLLFLTR